MATEPRRGCGYRKLGGLYLVAAGLAEPCHRLPFPLDVCPLCGAGVKPTRGWTWVDGDALAGVACAAPSSRAAESWREAADYSAMPLPHAGPEAWDASRNAHRDAFARSICESDEHYGRCALCRGELGRCGLLWVGRGHYSTPADFTTEAGTLGVSKRIATVPRGFTAGQTWVLLAHALACPMDVPPDPVELVTAPVLGPGVFHAFKPARVELMVPESERENAELLDRLAKRGITPVFLPDDDPDHQPRGGRPWHHNLDRLGANDE